MHSVLGCSGPWFSLCWMTRSIFSSPREQRLGIVCLSAGCWCKGGELLLWCSHGLKARPFLESWGSAFLGLLQYLFLYPWNASLYTFPLFFLKPATSNRLLISTSKWAMSEASPSVSISYLEHSMGEGQPAPPSTPPTYSPNPRPLLQTVTLQVVRRHEWLQTSQLRWLVSNRPEKAQNRKDPKGDQGNLPFLGGCGHLAPANTSHPIDHTQWPSLLWQQWFQPPRCACSRAIEFQNWNKLYTTLNSYYELFHRFSYKRSSHLFSNVTGQPISRKLYWEECWP